VISTRAPFESTDTVNVIVALLVRFPEISSIVARPSDGTVRLSFVVAQKLDRRMQRELTAVLAEHVSTFLELAGEEPAALDLNCETDDSTTFIHLTRDVASFTKAELQMQVALLTERFGEALVKNPPPDEPVAEDPEAADELVDCAIDVMREGGSHQKSLIGYREEKRVHVYFLKPGKKAKASARS
jgi:hypothetical protein